MLIPIATQVGTAYMASRQTGQQGQQAQQGMQQTSAQAMKSWDDSTFRQETAIRGPPPKESVSMVKYIVIAVIIIAVLLIYFGVGRKWVEPPKYESVFSAFTPTRVMDVHKPLAPMDSNSSRVFGVMPRQPIRVNV